MVTDDSNKVIPPFLLFCGGITLDVVQGFVLLGIQSPLRDQ